MYEDKINPPFPLPLGSRRQLGTSFDFFFPRRNGCALVFFFRPWRERRRPPPYPFDKYVKDLLRDKRALLSLNSLFDEEE